MKGLMYKEIVLGKVWLIAMACVQAAFIIGILLTAVNERGAAGAGENVMVLHMSSAISMFMMAMVTDDAFFEKDEKSKWCIFVSSTPGTMKEQILCKYYVILIENLLILFIGYILDVITVVILNDTTCSAGMIYFLFFCGFLFMKAFVNAFNVRFGSASGKTALMIFITAVFSGVMLWLLFGDISSIMEGQNESFIEFITRISSTKAARWITTLMPYIAVVAYYISYRISVKVYRKGVEHYEG